MKRDVTGGVYRYLLFCFLLAMIIVTMPLWAQEKPCAGHSCNDGVDVLVNANLAAGANTTTNSTDIGGSRAYAVGMGSIDVAINQCMGSTSWGFFVMQKQRLVENRWCIASSLYQMGERYAAALILCKPDQNGSQTLLGRLYGDEGQCITDLSAPPVEPLTAPETPSQADRLVEEQQVALAGLETSIRNLQASQRAIEQKAREDRAFRQQVKAEIESRFGGEE